MEAGKKNRKDIKVELLRCIACFMIIVTHIRVPDMAGGHPIKGSVLVESVSAVCVGLFFLITGCFLYDGRRTIRQTIRHFLEKTLLPVMIFVCTALLLEGWLKGEQSILSCIREADVPGILKAAGTGIFQMSSDYWGVACGHLWYIIEYTKLMFFFPVMCVLIKYAGDKILIYLAALNLCLAVKYDMNVLYGGANFFPYVEAFLRSSQMLLLTGCLLYRNREKLYSNRTRVLLFAAYAAGVLVTFFAQMRQFTASEEAVGPYFTTWTSGTGMITTILLAAFILSLPENLTIWKWMEKPVLFFGNLSFSIYLFHYVVIMKLETLGIAEQFRVMSTTGRGVLLYYAAYGLFVFVITAFICLALRLLKTVAVRLGSYAMAHRKPVEKT